MDVTAMLCNHAEAQNNLLYLSGAGVDRALIPPGAQPPWPLSVGVGINIVVPWTQTNQNHALLVEMVDADEQPVKLPTGPDTAEPFRAEMRFNVGRPPLLGTGEGQLVSLAVNVPSLPISSLGNYSFVIRVDGTEMCRLPYRVVSPPGMTMGPGAPSAS